MGLPGPLYKALKALELWAGISYEQGAGRVLLMRLYGQCLAIPSELGGMRHHLGWGVLASSLQDSRCQLVTLGILYPGAIPSCSISRALEATGKAFSHKQGVHLKEP